MARLLLLPAEFEARLNTWIAKRQINAATLDSDLAVPDFSTNLVACNTFSRFLT